MIRNRHASMMGLSVESKSRQTFVQGITTEGLNPKTALFFFSFIPQFVSREGTCRSAVPRFRHCSVLLNTSADLLVVGFAGSLAEKLTHRPKVIERQRTISGAGMIGLGLYVAASKSVGQQRM